MGRKAKSKLGRVATKEELEEVMTDQQIQLIDILRDNPDMTKREMAEAVNVCDKTIYNWFNDIDFLMYYQHVRTHTWAGIAASVVYKSLVLEAKKGNIKASEKLLEILGDDAYVRLKTVELDQKRQLIELEREKLELQKAQLKDKESEANSMGVLTAALANLIKPTKPDGGDDDEV